MENFQKVFILFILLNLAACVGTVQDTATPGSLKLPTVTTKFAFSGITSARGISHNKIEIEFFPMGGTEVEYKLTINDSSVPTVLDPKTLSNASGGKFLYTIDNLQPDREYKFKLRAFKPMVNAESENESEAYARTYDNVVSDFNGISKVSLVPGSTDSAINVDWIATKMSGIFTPGPYDTANYEITVISDIGGVANLNNPMYTGSDRKTTPIPTPPERALPLNNPSTGSVTGLAPNTRYYVQVRSVNVLYQNLFENPLVTNIPVSREKNTRYLTIKTSAGGGLFNFVQNNIILTNATGQDAFDKVNVFWQAGTGSFSGYRVFFRKYTGTENPAIDDKLTEATLVAYNSSNNFVSANSSLTTKSISGLETYATYQVKVALCKTVSCPVASSDPNAAIISDVKAIEVKPTLSPFSGVNSIQPPGQYNSRNVVDLKFDAPIVSAGFANKLEFYCVNPSDKAQMFLFRENDPIVAPGVPACDGLYLDDTPPALTQYTSQKVKGVKADGAHQYCFAASPAIVGLGSSDIRLPVNDRIVRCSYPEVIPPTIAQFAGTNGGCSISNTSGEVAWNLPAGGIYSGFKVFWKEKLSASKFSFSSAVTGDPAYSKSPVLSASTLNYTITSLIPGKTYQMGVLAVVDMDDPTPDLYSEFNLKVLECVVPLPIAEFKGFTRILALGPKTDARIPNDIVTKNTPESAKIFEAVNDEGIPFEVTMDTAIAPSLSLNFTSPPGRDSGTNFAGVFDGVAESATGYAISKNGMVSLAWEEVDMSFPEADVLFAQNQPAPPAVRTNRKYGYKVLRSSDNKLSWKELTLTNGLIYSTDYTYRARANSAPITKRMGFFTDYSVQAMDEIHNAAIAQDVARARIYYYKIVPIFDDHVLSYDKPNLSIVKVTLPPPNMALVHRWMANRAHCLELNKTIDISNNYSCEYNGVGATGKSIPHRIDETVFDQKGDLLVDRNELGCRYTRGDRVADPEQGTSIFNLGNIRRNVNDWNYFPLFKGYRTIAQAEDTTTPFKGCVGTQSRTRGMTGTAADYPPTFSPTFQHALQGDCIGRHGERIATNACTAQQYLENKYNTVLVLTPGAEIRDPDDCSDTSPNAFRHLRSKYEGNWASNIVMQSEFLAVFYNTYSSSLSSASYGPRNFGPAPGSLTASQALDTTWGGGHGYSQCSINLAAIDGSGYMKPRWISASSFANNRIQFKGDTKPLAEMTVDEVTEVRAATTGDLTLYNGNEGDPSNAEWKLPSEALRRNARYRGTTRMGRIFSSNGAKLPPLGKMSSDLARRLCSTYYVQTGIASDNGNFSPDSLPFPKRPLRRPESVTASAWPDSYDSAKIATLEDSNTTGSCNTFNKNFVGERVDKGELIGNRFSHDWLGRAPLVTGSSHQNSIKTNPELSHSASCVSRYGIQDMVGNVKEHNSEKIFCDYSDDSIFLGPVDTLNWGGGYDAVNARDLDDTGIDIPFFNTNSQRHYSAVLLSGADTAGTGSNFQVRFRNDPANPRNDYKPWVKSSLSSGYCSFTDNTPASRSGASNIFRQFNGAFNPILNPGGGLNSNIIKQTQPDQGSLKRWRLGDGRFFDFGPDGVAAALNKANTNSLTTLDVPTSLNTKKGKYFNPIVGMPLACNAESCNDESIVKFNDNVSVTSDSLITNIKPVDQQPLAELSEFPIGNSQIRHEGISDYYFDGAGFEKIKADHDVTSEGISDMLIAVEVDDKVSMANPTYITRKFPTDWTQGADVEYYKLTWDVERGAIFGFSSGGKANQRYAGRYTASIDRASDNTSFGTEDFNSGVRCGVMINEDP